MANEVFITLRVTDDDLSVTLERIAKRAKETGAAVGDEVGRGAASAQRALTQMGETARRIFEIFAGVNLARIFEEGASAVKAFITESVRLGMEAKVQEDAFARLTRSVGVSGDTLIKQLREASKETINQSDIMIAAARALQEGIRPDQIVRLMEIARNQSKLAGTDVTTAFNEITTAIANQQVRALKHFGIVVDLTQAHQKFATSIGVAKESLSEQGQTLALLNAVLEETGRKSAALTDANVSQSEKVQRTAAAWKDFKEGLGKFLIDVAFGVLDFFDRANRHLERFNANVERGQQMRGIAGGTGFEIEVPDQGPVDRSNRAERPDLEGPRAWTTAVTDGTKAVNVFQETLGRAQRMQELTAAAFGAGSLTHKTYIATLEQVIATLSKFASDVSVQQKIALIREEIVKLRREWAGPIAEGGFGVGTIEDIEKAIRTGLAEAADKAFGRMIEDLRHVKDGAGDVVLKIQDLGKTLDELADHEARMTDAFRNRGVTDPGRVRSDLDLVGESLKSQPMAVVRANEEAIASLTRLLDLYNDNFAKRSDIRLLIAQKEADNRVLLAQSTVDRIKEVEIAALNQVAALAELARTQRARLADAQLQTEIATAKATGDAWRVVFLAFEQDVLRAGDTMANFEKIGRQTAEDVRRAFSDILVAGIHGDIKSLGDAWQMFLNAMIRTLADFLASEVVKQFLAFLKGLTGSGGPQQLSGPGSNVGETAAASAVGKIIETIITWIAGQQRVTTEQEKTLKVMEAQREVALEIREAMRPGPGETGFGGPTGLAGVFDISGLLDATGLADKAQSIGRGIVSNIAGLIVGGATTAVAGPIAGATVGGAVRAGVAIAVDAIMNAIFGPTVEQLGFTEDQLKSFEQATQALAKETEAVEQAIAREADSMATLGITIDMANDIAQRDLTRSMLDMMDSIVQGTAMLDDATKETQAFGDAVQNAGDAIANATDAAVSAAQDAQAAADRAAEGEHGNEPGGDPGPGPGDGPGGEGPNSAHVMWATARQLMAMASTGIPPIPTPIVPPTTHFPFGGGGRLGNAPQDVVAAFLALGDAAMRARVEIALVTGRTVDWQRALAVLRSEQATLTLITRQSFTGLQDMLKQSVDVKDPKAVEEAQKKALELAERLRQSITERYQREIDFVQTLASRVATLTQAIGGGLSTLTQLATTFGGAGGLGSLRSFTESLTFDPRAGRSAEIRTALLQARSAAFLASRRDARSLADLIPGLGVTTAGIPQTIGAVRRETTDPVQRLQMLEALGQSLQGVLQDTLSTIQDVSTKQADALRTASDARVRALQDEAEFIQKTAETTRATLQVQIDLTKRWADVVSSVKSQLLGLQTGNLAPLNPRTEFGIAIDAFRRALAAFREDRTPETAKAVQDVATLALDKASDVMARPSPEYRAIYAEVTGGLEEIRDVAADQVDTLGDAVVLLARIDSTESAAKTSLDRINGQIATEQDALTAALARLAAQQAELEGQARTFFAERFAPIQGALQTTITELVGQRAAVDAQLRVMLGSLTLEQFIAAKNEAMVSELQRVNDLLARILEKLGVIPPPPPPPPPPPGTCPPGQTWVPGYG